MVFIKYYKCSFKVRRKVVITFYEDIIDLCFNSSFLAAKQPYKRLGLAFARDFARDSARDFVLDFRRRF